jgi:uncharacterized protein YecT (DUF1311 family)
MRFRLACAFLVPLSLHSLAPGQEVTLSAAKAAFESADAGLNQVYSEAKKSLQEWVFAELREDQRTWIEYRDYRANEAARYEGRAEEGKESLNVEYWKALSDLSKERVEIIRGWMKWDRFTSAWEGVWRDGRGGWLRIQQTKPGKFLFSLEVVRGPTYHLGNIGGEATWNGNSARFSIDSGTGEGETWLTFIKRELKVEVIGENTSEFHGARAYFEGEYLRTSELAEEDRQELDHPDR